MFTCPKCRRVQYFVCGNPNCVCHKRVPKNKLAQVWQVDGNSLACPYCGFVESADYWEDREVTQMFKKYNVHSFSELRDRQEA